MIRFDLKMAVGWGRRCETRGKRSGLQGNQVTFPSSASEKPGDFIYEWKSNARAIWSASAMASYMSAGTGEAETGRRVCPAPERIWEEDVQSLYE